MTECKIEWLHWTLMVVNSLVLLLNLGFMGYRIEQEADQVFSYPLYLLELILSLILLVLQLSVIFVHLRVELVSADIRFKGEGSSKVNRERSLLALFVINFIANTFICVLTTLDNVGVTIQPHAVWFYLNLSFLLAMIVTHTITLVLLWSLKPKVNFQAMDTRQSTKYEQLWSTTI